MKRRDFVVSSALGTLGASTSHLGLGGIGSTLTDVAFTAPPSAATRKILIAGGGFRTGFIKYMAELTGKARPRICYLPSASADQGIWLLSSIVSRYCSSLAWSRAASAAFSASASLS